MVQQNLLSRIPGGIGPGTPVYGGPVPYTTVPGVPAHAKELLYALRLFKTGQIPATQVIYWYNRDIPAARAIEGLSLDDAIAKLESILQPTPVVPERRVQVGPVPEARIPERRVQVGPVPYERIQQQQAVQDYGSLLGRVAQRPASRPVAPGRASPAPPLLSRLSAPVRPRSLAGAPSGQTARLRRLMGGF